MTNMLIRNARDDERDAIRDMAVAAYAQYRNMMPAPAWEGYRRNIQETLAEVGPEKCIVAVRDHTLVGSVLLYPAETHVDTGPLAGLRWPELRLLAVAPEARGQGIGRALVDECIQRARVTGATLLGLHTTDMMQVAQRMYVGMGFVHTPELDFHPAPNMVVKGYVLHLDNI